MRAPLPNILREPGGEREKELGYCGRLLLAGRGTRGVVVEGQGSQSPRRFWKKHQPGNKPKHHLRTPPGTDQGGKPEEKLRKEEWTSNPVH